MKKADIAQSDELFNIAREHRVLAPRLVQGSHGAERGLQAKRER